VNSSLISSEQASSVSVSCVTSCETDFNETVDMADGGVQEMAPQTDATITSQDTTVMAATVQMTHTTEETQNVQPEEEAEDATPVIQVNASGGCTD